MCTFFAEDSTTGVPIGLALYGQLNLGPSAFAVSVPLNTAVGVTNTSVAVSMLTLTTTGALKVIISLPATLLLYLVSAINTYNTSNMTNNSLLLVPITYTSFNVDGSVTVRIINMNFVVDILRSTYRATLGDSDSILFATITRFSRHHGGKAFSPGSVIPRG